MEQVNLLKEAQLFEDWQVRNFQVEGHEYIRVKHPLAIINGYLSCEIAYDCWEGRGFKPRREWKWRDCLVKL